jgi:hypothetical protein
MVRLDQDYCSLVDLCCVPYCPCRLPAACVRQQRVGETLDSLVYERVGFVGSRDERVEVRVPDHMQLLFLHLTTLPPDPVRTLYPYNPRAGLLSPGATIPHWPCGSYGGA